MSTLSAHHRTHHGPGQWLALAGFAAAAFVTAAIGGLGVQGTAAEYNSLAQPAWAPPDWLFGPVWTVLYAMIALSGWLAWRRAGWTTALTVYAVQLGLNAVWTPLFFGAGQYGLALIDIILLWLSIAAVTALFRRISTLAALLLVPYLLWVTYATALNAAIWSMN
ncbi:TspO/MBR family protein [Catenuloplanes atrovinosus]|uniref:Tryptophan-rich sensory protein n=1 Tax=Catenuloplanes atrovinosus TaxID=137266 RepID=A0AAE3YVL3_9ACTN|nr:TspO/MBR family protein [Catenuloplanes atrovinosus]MDR7278826.1 tryptophan-rich sensory protein [Catenuloplanes atrovinosus]